MKIAILCEYSGITRDAFTAKGHNAISCDLLPTEKPGKHYQGDLFDILHHDWDFIGSHFSCTNMANSGVRWLFNADGSKNLERWVSLERDVTTFREILAAIKVGYAENPIPHKYAREGFESVVTGQWVEGIGDYTQTVQPWQFGHTTSKRTCLWLKGLPKLKPTNTIPKHLHTYDVHLASPGPDRWKERSRTFTGIAEAMAEQWG